MIALTLSFDTASMAVLHSIDSSLKTLIAKSEAFMTVIDDLNQAVTALQAEVVTAISGIQGLSGNIAQLISELAAAVAANNPTAISTATASLTKASADLDTAIKAAQTAVPNPLP
jgi:hypothetical protein